MGRTVGSADTFEFQVIAPQLGIAHPTGYPLYLILGKLDIAAVWLSRMAAQSRHSHLRADCSRIGLLHRAPTLRPAFTCAVGSGRFRPIANAVEPGDGSGSIFR